MGKRRTHDGVCPQKRASAGAAPEQGNRAACKGTSLNWDRVVAPVAPLPPLMTLACSSIIEYTTHSTLHLIFSKYSAF